MKHERIRYMTMTGLFAAMICMTTAFILHVPTPNGYIHIGDALVYLAACLLPMPYGVAAAGIGGALADLLSGYPVYMLPTLLIKSLNAMCFYAVGKRTRLLCPRTVAAAVLSMLVTIVGYYLAAVVLYGGWRAQLMLTVPANAVQGLCSGAVFCLAAFMLDKAAAHRQLS